MTPAAPQYFVCAKFTLKAEEYAKSEMFILNSGTVEPTMGGWVRERLKQ